MKKKFAFSYCDEFVQTFTNDVDKKNFKHLKKKKEDSVRLQIKPIIGELFSKQKLFCHNYSIIIIM